MSWAKNGHNNKVADGAYVAGADADFEVPGGLLGETLKHNMFDAAAAPKAAAVVSRRLLLASGASAVITGSFVIASLGLRVGL